ncbi:MAG: UV DNA damage repair endonuclease UvsE [Janthinobacterium lividum]
MMTAKKAAAKTTSGKKPEKPLTPAQIEREEKLKAKEKLARKKANMKAARDRKKSDEEAAQERRLTQPMASCGWPTQDADGLTMPAFPVDAMRLGFPVKVMGRPDLKSNDTRGWRLNPHLRVSLGYMCETFEYLRQHDIRMYRMSSDLAPYHTHPDMPQFHNMVEESRADLEHVGKLAKAQGLRLSFHPSQYIVLNSDNEALTQKSIADLQSQATMLDYMELPPEAIMVIHVGGAYGNRALGCDNWVKTWSRLSEPIQRRMVLENDDIRFSSADVLSIHERTGVKCVFDYQHHWCMNPEGLPLVDTLARFLKTWPTGVRPKMHFSCARTEMREIKRKNKKTGLIETVLQPPIWTGHADYNNPFETLTFLRSIQHLETDIMLESKAKDLSLIRLRNDIARFAPELAPRYGIKLGAPLEDVGEMVEESDGEAESPE